MIAKKQRALRRSRKPAKQTEAEAQARSEAMGQYELALIVAYNALMQWISRCGAAAGAARFSPLDLLVLRLVNNRLREKRLSDICFALKIEDTHTISYALKKLIAAGLVASQRSKNETLFASTPEGQDLCDRYYAVRRRFLLNSIAALTDDELDVTTLAGLLRALSGLYEQAARNAATS
jgi:predicted MarR family transcription regulator